VARIGRLCAGAVVVTAVVLISWPRVASAQSATFRSAPASGAPGTVISVAAVTPCLSPVAGTPFVRVFLQRGSATLGSATFTVTPEGSWSGSLRVGAGATQGSAQLSAFCFASPQAEGALVAYQPHKFAVLVGTPSPSGLPVTGAPTLALLALASGLIVAGAAILAGSGGRTFKRHITWRRRHMSGLSSGRGTL
jgi:hypothetical protein